MKARDEEGDSCGNQGQKRAVGRSGAVIVEAASAKPEQAPEPESYTSSTKYSLYSVVVCDTIIHPGKEQYLNIDVCTMYSRQSRWRRVRAYKYRFA